eukprot:m.19121 g.19121  ORF g.19121 m.19121 type:complete len:246 (+) comp6490_c0_seq1:224-961(+)
MLRLSKRIRVAQSIWRANQNRLVNSPPCRWKNSGINAEESATANNIAHSRIEDINETDGSNDKRVLRDFIALEKEEPVPLRSDPNWKINEARQQALEGIKKLANQVSAEFTPLDELESVIGNQPEIDIKLSKNKLLFLDMLRSSPLASLGHDMKGLRLEGEVVEITPRAVGLDVGLKFLVYAELNRNLSVSYGDLVEVEISDPEKSMALLGDPRHSTIQMGTGKIVSTMLLPKFSSNQSSNDWFK